MISAAENRYKPIQQNPARLRSNQTQLVDDCCQFLCGQGIPKYLLEDANSPQQLTDGALKTLAKLSRGGISLISNEGVTRLQQPEEEDDLEFTVSFPSPRLVTSVVEEEEEEEVEPVVFLYSILCLWRWCWAPSPLEILSRAQNTPTLFILTESTSKMETDLVSGWKTEDSCSKCLNFPDCSDSRDIMKKQRGRYTGNLVSFIASIVNTKK